MSNIYTRGGSRDWTKPAVFKITPAGNWWATVKDPQGKYHTDFFGTHPEAMQQAAKYAAGVYE